MDDDDDTGFLPIGDGDQVQHQSYSVSSDGSLLDEDGFPSFQLGENKDDQDSPDKEEKGGSMSNNTDFFRDSSHDQNGETAIGDGGFAADFFSAGSDWSCLLVSSERKLKQANLFQMWGVNKNTNTNTQFSVSNSLTSKYYTNRNGDCYDRVQRKKMKTGDWGSISSVPPNKCAGSESFRERKIAAVDNRAPRSCPFYKKMPGTTFTVDAFRYGGIEGCSAYFLSHFHFDHYGGLNKRWTHGPIYCTPLTARLVQMCLSVNPLYICPLELNTEHVIEGVKVTLLEANHCPGAALFHFMLSNRQCYLHTGDFRASKMMQAYPLLANQRINILYLDTTYCNPKYKFPCKEDVLNYVVRITKDRLKNQPKTLVVIGAYSIGKECVYLAISKALGVKIYANASRRRILLSFDWPELSKNLCTDGKKTPLHVLPISSLKFENLKDYLETYKERHTSILAFRPTGWTYSDKTGNSLDLIKPNSRGNITIYGVPYSEHSSFTELQAFVQFLRPDKIIPTVNVSNPANREKMQSCFRDWLKG